MNRPDESIPAVEETHDWAVDEPERDLTGVTLGDFRVERLLGRGGMGEVYLARQVSLSRPVALKVLRPAMLTRPAYLARFEAEATAVAKLNHPNIVHVYTLGSVDGVRFIAMEYVLGTTLKDYIRKKGALDYPLALSIMRQAGLAVGAAGEIGLVHRDIKPENLLLTKKGQVKVADFGLCRDLDADRVSVTQPGITMGTPLYMSPEQAQGKDLDHRSDLYSLGVTFYHMITGVTPFRADSALALALKHVKDTPASMTVHRPDVPPELDRFVLKLMAKSPTDRHQSAGEMLKDLAKVREVVNASSGAVTSTDVSGPTLDLKTLGGPPGAVADEPTEPEPAEKSGLSKTFFLSGSDLAPWFGPRARAAAVAASLAAGAAAGWLGRGENLLAGPQAPGSSPPALWTTPAWKAVPKKNGPEDQYRAAQLAGRDDQEAAWLAVPGHFPKSREWASRAYTQLARLLLSRGDARRLQVLADEVEHWDGAQTHERELARVARAGVDALGGDVDGVLDGFDKLVNPKTLTDPALMELCLEVIDRVELAASRPGATSSAPVVRPRLREIQVDLMRKLIRSEMRDLAPGPGLFRRPPA